jgi:hypothetical protein
MEEQGLIPIERDYDGRFTGFRVNTESVPRLPVTVARRAIKERRIQLALWVDHYDGELAYVGIVEPGADSSAVVIRGSSERTGELITLSCRPLPWNRVDRLFVCPGCRRQRRHLYAFAVVGGRLTSTGCQSCGVTAALQLQ